ncbi:laminin EGF-like protein [Ancylostoma caninum]|uniref:Laminin EGF-like protein n=1 Tax=Ancylostoma caninum TaxID=29170 RepID=A0A368EWV0_ANCCA|nr:laminin EGF-like protein [Ancylostoma caninum]
MFHCFRCVCNNLGSNLTAGTCDRVTGQCPCHPNVIGMQCDQCAENHYDLSSGQGCSACACDPNGVVLKEDGTPELQCNQFDGRCRCKVGRGDGCASNKSC